jgi:hypothetical protein
MAWGSSLAGLITVPAVFASVALITFALRSARHRASVVWLSEVPIEPPPRGWPTLAIIFAARNEAAGVDRATRSMINLSYPDFQVIAVDDRSTDETGAILDAIAHENPRLRVEHIRALPDGWLGKNHALQSAADAARAPWLLFTDADIVFEPTTLQRAISHAERLRLDHLVATPDTQTESELERAFMTFFVFAFAMNAPPWKVSDRRSKVAMGVGAFNLVRAEAFHAIGGFRHLALSIDDDMRLGQALKFTGYRSAVVLGGGMLTVRWHHSLWGMVRGLEKNFFAALNFQLVRVPFALLVIATVGLGPFAGLLVGPWWSRLLCAVAIGSSAGVLAVARRQHGLAWYHVFALPLGSIACAIALIRSTWLTLWRGGVVWRDHLYPLAQLRAHVRQRDAWARTVWKSTR